MEWEKDKYGILEENERCRDKGGGKKEGDEGCMVNEVIHPL